MDARRAAFLGDGGHLVVADGDALLLWDEASGFRRVGTCGYGVDLMCGSRDGEHFAFWQRQDERFYLLHLSGEEVFSGRIDTDKAMPHEIVFSGSGDGVAFTWDYDGAHFLYFLNVKKGYKTQFGPSRNAIGYDKDLRRFVELPFHSGPQAPPEVTLLDRHRSPREFRPWDGWQWRCMGIERAGGTPQALVIVCEDEILWLPLSARQPDLHVVDWMPRDRSVTCYTFLISVSHDLALVWLLEPAQAVLVNRRLGRVWEGANLVSAQLCGPHAVAQHRDGGVEVVAADGSMALRCAPISETQTIAATVTDKTLLLAQTPASGGRISLHRQDLRP